MSESLFSGNILTYITTTTDTQWQHASSSGQRYFEHPTLSSLLDDLDAIAAGQVSVLSRPVLVSWTDWLQDVTLQQLQTRVVALNTQYGTLYSVNPLAATRQATVTQSRVNDLTQLGVYLYGLGASDGLYGDDGQS